MTDLELVDAQRLAEALERLEAGIDPDLDPREDPSLFALVALAADIRDVEELATDAQRYRSYRERSRDHVLRRIARRAPSSALPQQAATALTTEPVLTTEIVLRALLPVVIDEPRQRRIPFLHWSYLAPMASAAAAAVLVLAFVAAQPNAAPTGPAGAEQAAAVEPTTDTGPTETVAELPSALGSPLDPDPVLPWEVVPPTAALGSIEFELYRLDQLIGTVARQVADRTAVDTELLRSITESTAAVADRIEQQPDSLSQLHVITYIQSAAYGRTVLATATADAETEDALSAARRATQDGVLAASAYFQQRP